MKKIIDWFKESNRYLPLLLGVVVGLLPTAWWDAEVLAAGVNTDYLLKLGFIATL